MRCTRQLSRGWRREWAARSGGEWFNRVRESGEYEVIELE